MNANERMNAASAATPSSGASVLGVVNPATLLPVGQVRLTLAEEWPRALAAARAAAQHWEQTPPSARAGVMRDMSAAIQGHERELALLHAEETGQPLAESIEAVSEAAAIWRRAAADAAGADSNAGGEPVMLCPALENPLVDWAHLASAALVQRIPAIVTLDPRAPLTDLRAASLRPGLPAGLLAPHAFALNAMPAAMARIHRGASSNASHALEAIFVGADADTELAVAGVAGLRLRRSGQLPMQSARVYVEQSQIYRFAEALHVAMAFLEAGDPTDPRTDLGPLGSAAALAEVTARVGEALRCGVLLKLGGRRYQPWGLTGYFFQPTLLIEGRAGERAPQDQMAGPVIVLSPVRNLAEALADRPAESPIRMHVFSADFMNLRATLPEAWQRRIVAAPGSAADPVELTLHRVRDPRWFPYQARSASR